MDRLLQVCIPPSPSGQPSGIQDVMKPLFITADGTERSQSRKEVCKHFHALSHPHGFLLLGMDALARVLA